MEPTYELPISLLAVNRRLASIHLAECQHQCLDLRRTKGLGHPDYIKAAHVLREATALVCALDAQAAPPAANDNAYARIPLASSLS